jgi:hypothetical protein
VLLGHAVMSWVPGAATPAFKINVMNACLGSAAAALICYAVVLLTALLMPSVNKTMSVASGIVAGVSADRSRSLLHPLLCSALLCSALLCSALLFSALPSLPLHVLHECRCDWRSASRCATVVAAVVAVDVAVRDHFRSCRRCRFRNR